MLKFNLFHMKPQYILKIWSFTDLLESDTVVLVRGSGPNPTHKRVAAAVAASTVCLHAGL